MYYLRVRTTEGLSLVTVWLVRQDGAGHSGMMVGEMLPSDAEELVKALGLTADRGHCPMPVAGGDDNATTQAIVHKQRTLFD